MLKLSNIKMKPKMIGLFLITGLVPLILVGFQSTRVAKKSLMESSFNQLEGVREIKKVQIQKFFDERQGDMGVLVETVSTLQQEAFAKLTAIRETKKASVESYFEFIDSQMVTFSEDQMVIDAMNDFKKSFYAFRTENSITDVEPLKNELASYYTDEFGVEYASQNNDDSANVEALLNQLDEDAVAFQYHYIKTNPNALGSKHEMDRADDGSSYSMTHGQIHPIIRNYLDKFGYYDIFLVDIKTGDIVYSVFKELDYATSLLDGPYADTNFGEAFRLAKESDDPQATFLVDYKKYKPSYEAAASFIASPIYNGTEKIGVAIFQMPIDRLNTIMAERAGLGETGETYLVGPDNLMRSDSYLDPENRSVTASFRDPENGSVVTVASTKAIGGQSGTEIIDDYRGDPVLSAYSPVSVGGNTWALMAEIDVAEAFVPIDLEGNEFFANYVDLYGYYDIFLMNPDGYCFYTAAKEADYQTNLLTGAYKDSGLGILTSQVIKSNEFGLIDFAPYAPSNGEPAAFIAQPVINDEKILAIVALQLSLDAINGIMQQRQGMGETGETYLVGKDNLMRSDSFLDPEGHSVMASFANPETGSVNSDATKDALNGVAGEKIVIDYNNNPVLSAYTPLEIHGLQWALMAEIDLAEVEQPVNALMKNILAVALGIALIVGITALYIALVISKPLVTGVGFAQAVADGDLTQQADIHQNDEIGLLVKAMNSMADNLRGIMKNVFANSSTLNNSSEDMKEMATKFNDRADSMNNLSASAAAAAEQASSNIKGVAAGIEEVSANSISVASATEEVSQNLNTVGAAVEQMSANMGTISTNSEDMSKSATSVASAVEEMSASLQEVSSNTTQAATIATSAAEKADSTATTVGELGHAAQEIDKVIDLITGIAAQTNLLALNATIEAASAGEAGKGFAVVANEVKELAKQTSSATEDIRGQVETMQNTTGNAVNAIEEIVTVIGQVNESFTTIATAVEQQTASVNEISSNIGEVASGAELVSNNVQQAAQGAQEVSRNVQEASTGVNEISQSVSELAAGTNEISRNASEAAQGMNEVAKNVEQVSAAASETQGEATNLNTASEQCAELSVELQELVNKFKV
jgi:methyl-accepting chemotaxis protein